MKFKKWIKITTTYSSSFWLETHQSESPVYYSDFQTISSVKGTSCIDLVSCQQLVLTLRSEPSSPVEAQLSFKSGILQAKKDLKQLPPHTTRELMELSLFTISPIDNPSKILRTGLLKSTNTETKTSWKC